MTAKVIAHSSSKGKPDLITVELEYPRFIHGELMTHRVFSRNASSSRAIPIRKMIAKVWKNPAKPTYWGTNKSGMQAGKELKGLRLLLAKSLWTVACAVACTLSYALHLCGLHKQHANRLTEPFQYINVLVTATEWDNFFKLRSHSSAQPEIKELSDAINLAISNSTPKVLNESQWHLPYILDEDIRATNSNYDLLCKISSARCARLSYMTHGNKEIDRDKDFRLFNQLAGSDPMHLSPTEHQATPSDRGNANFKGWKQFRYNLGG